MTQSAVSKTQFQLEQDGTLRVQGPLTRDSVALLWPRWRQEVLAQTVSAVDMSQVDVIDTAGVALLVELIKNNPTHSLDCHGATSQLQQIAAVSGVESLLSLS